MPQTLYHFCPGKKGFLEEGACISVGDFCLDLDNRHKLSFNQNGTLTFQRLSDGCVIYRSHKEPVPNAAKACMQKTGNLDFLDKTGRVIWRFPTTANYPYLDFKRGGDLCIFGLNFCTSEYEDYWCAQDGRKKKKCK
jgi:hypothetical protein